MIYLDSCAIVKLVTPEPESAALVQWLNDRPGETIVTSTLAEVEVSRALRRSAPGVLGTVTSILSGLARFEIDGPVRATAAAYLDKHLRTLDAIHLATAENLLGSDKPLTAFVTYDKRLATAVSEAGLLVVAPGA